jgi:hypothetical protein
MSNSIILFVTNIGHMYSIFPVLPQLTYISYQINGIINAREMTATGMLYGRY